MSMTLRGSLMSLKRDAGYILTMMPPRTTEEAMFSWTNGADGCITNAARAMKAVDEGESLGTWSAPVGALAGSICFLRVGKTSGKRFARVARSMQTTVLPGDGLLAALKTEGELVSSVAGRIIAVARLESDSVVAGGPRSGWAWLGVPQDPVSMDGHRGILVDSFGPYGRKISSFGGLTMLDSDEVKLLLMECGLDTMMV